MDDQDYNDIASQNLAEFYGDYDASIAHAVQYQAIEQRYPPIFNSAAVAASSPTVKVEDEDRIKLELISPTICQPEITNQTIKDVETSLYDGFIELNGKSFTTGVVLYNETNNRAEHFKI